MCSRLFSMQLQFWSAWNGIINLAGGHVWVVVVVEQGEKLRLWVVADVGELVGLQSFWGVTNKETELFSLFFLAKQADFAEVQFWTVNERQIKREEEEGRCRNLRNLNSQFTQIIPIKGCLRWQRWASTVAGQRMQKQRTSWNWIITQVSTEKLLKFRAVNRSQFYSLIVRLWTIPLQFLTRVKINFRL